MILSPKQRRNITRIIPYGVIWVLAGWVNIINELGITGNQNLNPETNIAFTIPVLIFANLANLLVGFIVGFLEVVYLEKKFSTHILLAKFAYKFFVYFLLFLLVIVVFFPIAYTIETGISITHPDAWNKLVRFINSITFALTLFQLSVSLILSLIYSAVSENLGHHVFLNLITGKYHKPIVEQRIFMFLDMKSSTSIAESLGHAKYFELLKKYYDLMSEPIVNSMGEVYQYIGDEVVISWVLKDGIANENCLRCFFEIKERLKGNQEKLSTEYGFQIDFKAGLHYGDVTVGEVGALKKEIVFTGDPLNTTSRIQGLCNELKADILISGQLKEMLPECTYQFSSKGKHQLRGREEKEELFEVLK